MTRGIFILAIAGFELFCAVFFSGRFMGLISGGWSKGTCYWFAMFFFVVTMAMSGMGLRILLTSK